MLKIHYPILICFIFLPFCLYGQDTIKTKGGYETGKLNKKNIRKGYWDSYDSLGTIHTKKYYRKNRSKPYKIIRYNYQDSTYSEGRRNPYSGKTGKYKTYTLRHELIIIEHYKYNKLHGKTRNLVERTSEHYYFGLTREELYNSKKQRYVFLFITGMPVFRDRKYEEDLYACKSVRIAGCLVNNNILRKQSIHNFFVTIKQSVRFGSGWKKRYFGVD